MGLAGRSSFLRKLVNIISQKPLLIPRQTAEVMVLSQLIVCLCPIERVWEVSEGLQCPQAGEWWPLRGAQRVTTRGETRSNAPVLLLLFRSPRHTLKDYLYSS